MDSVERMRQLAPDQFHCLVKMHLSFLLDLTTDDCDCSFVNGLGGRRKKEGKVASQKKKLHFPGTPKKAPSSATASAEGVMEGAPLTMEGVCQIYQIIEYLHRHMKTEGIFRKHGNLKKQHTLRERLNRGVAVDLDDQEFSVHECASVLKTFLADLKEPLLTDAYYRAHCQVAGLNVSEAGKRLQCLQLLFLLIPQANYVLLKDTLLLLQKVAQHKETNKMDATNLATVFATHIMCPRKLSPGCLQSNHLLYIKAVCIMIDKADELFDIPSQLFRDADAYWKDDIHPRTPTRTSSFSSPVVKTVYSFVDRERTQKLASQSTTETALAELYAQVQSMPESAQKRKLIHKLNDANGCGTPATATKSKKGSRFINLLRTPRGGLASNKKQKEGRSTGSYSLRPARDCSSAAPSFKRQHSGAQQDNSPLLPPAAKRLMRPAPPARTSSLPAKKSPVSRKPLMEMSPGLEANSRDDDSGCNVSITSSIISAEAAALLSGQLIPSNSMTAFLDGVSPGDDGRCNSARKRQTRKRSITELGGPNPLAKTPPRIGTPDSVYFETNL